MGRDVKVALPNSVRITTSGTVTALEFLGTLDAARYVDGAPLANQALVLDFTAADGAFSSTGAGIGSGSPTRRASALR